MVNDNRPFFFYSATARDLSSMLWPGAARGDNPSGEKTVLLLLRLAGVSVLATALLLALPALLLGHRLPRGGGTPRFLLYFIFTGTGYVLVQITLIQTFVLFLGRPALAITTVVFSMMVSSGVGSLFSRRLLGASDPRLNGALATAALLVGLLAVAASPVTTTAAGWRLWVKLIATLALIAPAGFAMGMTFPVGLARMDARNRPAVGWAWTLNGGASVLGSAVAIVLTVNVGLRETLLIGGIMYLLAMAALASTSRSATWAESEGRFQAPE